MTRHIEENMQIVSTSVLLDYLQYNNRSISALFVSDILAQFSQLDIKDKNMLSLNVTDAVYNVNMSEFLVPKYIIDSLSNNRATLF